jgi:hypothetical protein
LIYSSEAAQIGRALFSGKGQEEAVNNNNNNSNCACMYVVLTIIICGNPADCHLSSGRVRVCARGRNGLAGWVAERVARARWSAAKFAKRPRFLSLGVRFVILH